MMYMVMGIMCKVTMTTVFGDSEVDLNWAEGMIGAMPVFDCREDAEFYAGEGLQIVEVKIQGDKVCRL